MARWSDVLTKDIKEIFPREAKSRQAILRTKDGAKANRQINKMNKNLAFCISFVTFARYMASQVGVQNHPRGELKPSQSAIYIVRHNVKLNGILYG